MTERGIITVKRASTYGPYAISKMFLTSSSSSPRSNFFLCALPSTCRQTCFTTREGNGGKREEIYVPCDVTVCRCLVFRLSDLSSALGPIQDAKREGKTKMRERLEGLKRDILTRRRRIPSRTARFVGLRTLNYEIL
jgi:hypothetical protein